MRAEGVYDVEANTSIYFSFFDIVDIQTIGHYSFLIWYHLYVSVQTERILQEPIYNLPETISMIVQTKVSLGRIASFLHLDDLKPDVIERLPRGATTIWSFDEEPRFREKNMKLSDSFSWPVFHTAGAIEWLCFHLDMLSSIAFAFSLVFLISIPPGACETTQFCFLLSRHCWPSCDIRLNLNMLQAMVIWSLCNLENKIISVERIIQYSNIPSEPPLVIETNRPAHSRPSHGKIDIHDLQGLTCTFPGGLKTGIVGRTGSGKSTLIRTLFRIVEPAAGQIIIDGVNISSIGLHDLQSRLSIIPQDPTMFEGTVRSNLDPLEEYTDEQIWEVRLIEEYDSPARLLENKSPSFAQLVAEYTTRSNSSFDH
ncbi:hypothetical protein SLEP1_g46555 [Rubroshorea leprosula]|uniref:ABC transporter domain-containing protein n=1 Tax=Rubroshorea leprosula TaxID=152421 RepID=A0AAV5LPP6_9ROSI|nr:hypothetical protein SLEP1_g46555 [Rubroshorea leprosula]